MASWIKESPPSVGTRFSLNRTAKFTVFEPKTDGVTNAEMNGGKAAPLAHTSKRALPEKSSKPVTSDSGKKGSGKKKIHEGKAQGKSPTASNGVIKNTNAADAPAPAKRGRTRTYDPSGQSHAVHQRENDLYIKLEFRRFLFASFFQEE